MFEIDKNGFMGLISWIMNKPTPKGILAHQDDEIKTAWAQFAVEMNIDKLYESAE